MGSRTLSENVWGSPVKNLRLCQCLNLNKLFSTILLSKNHLLQFSFCRVKLLESKLKFLIHILISFAKAFENSRLEIADFFILEQSLVLFKNELIN